MCTGTNASVPLRLGFDLACDDGVRSRTNSSSSVSSWTGVSIYCLPVPLLLHYGCALSLLCFSAASLC